MPQPLNIEKQRREQLRWIIMTALDAARPLGANEQLILSVVRELIMDLTPRELKAWSQNLGHESVLTSLGSYGTLRAHEQADVMGAIARQGDPKDDAAATLAAIQAVLARSRVA